MSSRLYTAAIDSLHLLQDRVLVCRYIWWSNHMCHVFLEASRAIWQIFQNLRHANLVAVQSILADCLRSEATF